MANPNQHTLPPEILLNIARQNSAAGRALHLADPTLSGLSTPAVRLAWYHRRDRRGRTWIETPDQCLRHNYADPTPFDGPMPHTTVLGCGWYKFGKLHRENDLPAFIHTDGVKEWYRDDYQHRDNDPDTDQPRPAYESPEGVCSYHRWGSQYYPDGDIEYELQNLVKKIREHHDKFTTGEYSGKNFDLRKLKISRYSIIDDLKELLKSPAAHWKQYDPAPSMAV